MAATSTVEVDLMLKKAIELLHSPNPNSATEMRLMLDELMLQRFGPDKMLSNTLTQMQLDEEKNFPGMMSTPIQVEAMETDEIINLTHSPAKTISDSADSDNDGNARAASVTSGISATVTSAAILTDVAAEDDGNLKEFGDLNCCVCGEMVFTATNRLIECSNCGSLYHQECHKPPISDEDAIEDHEHNWQCDNCFNKPSTSKATAIISIQEEPVPLLTKAKSATSSRSSSTSNSSVSLQKQEPVTLNVSSKHHKRTSKSSKEERSNSSKHATTEKSSSSSSSSKRSSHSSSSGRSKSSKHESSSSKRKSNK